MIDGYRRGIQAAGEEVSKYSQDLPVEEIKNIAERTLACMKQANFAHLEPEKEFIRGFTEQFQLLQKTTVASQSAPGGNYD